MTDREYILRELTRISKDIESLRNMVSKVQEDRTSTFTRFDDKTCTTGTSAIDDYIAICTDNGRRNKI